MKNDIKILEIVKDIYNIAGYYINYVEYANPCAHTDRMLERLISQAEEVNRLHQQNFEETEDFVWDGCCPYCNSSNVDIVDEDNADAKYICRDCGEDFLVDNTDGSVRDRHGFIIKREEYIKATMPEKETK